MDLDLFSGYVGLLKKCKFLFAYMLRKPGLCELRAREGEVAAGTEH